MERSLGDRIRQNIASGKHLNKAMLGRWAAEADVLQQKRDALAEECRLLTNEVLRTLKLMELYVKECGGAEAKTPDDWGKDVVLLTLQRRAAEITRKDAALREVERLNNKDSATWRSDIAKAVLRGLAPPEEGS